MKNQKSNLTDFQIAKQVSVCQQLDKVTGGRGGSNDPDIDRAKGGSNDPAKFVPQTENVVIAWPEVTNERAANP